LKTRNLIVVILLVSALLLRADEPIMLGTKDHKIVSPTTIDFSTATVLGLPIPSVPLSSVTAPITNTGGVVGFDQTANYLWTGTHLFTNPAAASVPVIIKGAPTQTANLTEWRNSTNAVVASISADGSRLVLNPAGNAPWAIGPSTTVSTPGSLAIGSNASATGQGTAIGYGTSSLNAGVAIGMSATCAANSVAIGNAANAGTNSFALGPTANASVNASISIGYGSNSGGTGNFVSGGNAVPMNDVYFGKGFNNASPTAWTLHGTGGNGTDITGADLVLAGGKGTGAGLGGSVRIQVAPAGTTGSSPNALVNALTVNTAGVAASGFTNVGVTFAGLPAAPATGQTACVTDGAASLAWGATVTGGGTAKYLVWYNGTNWTVAGK
jgi:hypothetical protein